jgi:hypothetical protein
MAFKKVVQGCLEGHRGPWGLGEGG